MPITTDPAATTGLPEPNRRGFLRGLTTLPLIGGGVTLIGAPTAVAEPVSQALLDSYDAWLDAERRFLKWERHRKPMADQHTPRPQCVWYDPATGQMFDYVPAANAGHAWHYSGDPRLQPQPSTRAALVLATVGCDWREGGR